MARLQRTARSAKTTSHINVQSAARDALGRILEPLAAFVLHSGLGIRDLQHALRDSVVQSVAARQIEVAKRINISGIAASTGISRAEISKILKSAGEHGKAAVDHGQQLTNRILAAWQQDPKFTTQNGQAADLKLYGRGASFDALVKQYGRGIPTRAVFDELIRASAIELVSAQVVRLKSAVVVDKGINPRAVKAFGDRVSKLIATLMHNMRYPKDSEFVASISDISVPLIAIPLIRREISSNGASFLSDMQDMLINIPTEVREKTERSESVQLSVTIFYHEEPRKIDSPRREIVKRRNFRRSN